MKNQFKPLILAYYLPQYHPFPENDEWWGKGFTEWTNVGNAKPLFKGHYQPKVPKDLGYYDLRLPIVRQQQVDLAHEAGVSGFCYWHYWFGNGRQLMNEIIDDVISSGKPDFPFCFGWANESWKAKQWNKNGKNDLLLMEQVYGGKSDYLHHFEYAKKAFMDSRYVKIDNKPVFLIYKPHDLPIDFIPFWNSLAKQSGFDGIFFVARIMSGEKYDDLDGRGFDMFTCERVMNGYNKNNYLKKLCIKLSSKLKHIHIAISYKSSMDYFTVEDVDSQENFAPSLIPNWDHSPRSKEMAYALTDPDPSLFFQHAVKVLNIVRKKKNQLVFLKSWNEWGEGNYMEPDLKYGKGYITALKKAIDKVKEM